MGTIPDEFLAKLLRVQEIIIGSNHYSIFILANFIKPNLIYHSIRKAWYFTDKHALTESADETIHRLTIVWLLNDVLENTKSIKIQKICIIVILSLIPFDLLNESIVLEIKVLFLIQSDFRCVICEVFRLYTTVLTNRLQFVLNSSYLHVFWPNLALLGRKREFLLIKRWVLITTFLLELNCSYD